MTDTRRELTNTVVSFSRPEDSIRRRLQQIHVDALARSPHLREADFKAIHPNDLAFLFDAYDDLFFARGLRQALLGRSLTFRLSPRLTKAGGTTTRARTRAGEVTFEITVAISMLFDGFGETDRLVTVGGLPCENRLQALQRIFEHELVHLSEMLCWDYSNCAAPRFQDIAARLFLHQAHTHNLITRRERAAESGIRPGSRVAFQFEERKLIGRVNRITKRATVLVEDAGGVKFSDGGCYKTYYVPLASLELVSSPSTEA